MEKHKDLMLEIIKPTFSKTFPVEWIDVEGLSGNFLIGPDHYPLISILKPETKVIYKLPAGEEESINIFTGGIVKVKDNYAIIILDD